MCHHIINYSTRANEVALLVEGAGALHLDDRGGSLAPRDPVPVVGACKRVACARYRACDISARRTSSQLEDSERSI
jgi:hypothetical protein